MDAEIKAISAISEALGQIEDPEARKRVLRWANEKFGYVPVSSKGAVLGQAGTGTPVPVVGGGDGKEMPGIARVSGEGELRLTVRDVKARSAMDAVVRLAHIAIRAHELLTGQKSISSKNVLVPLLKSWRVYDGNARTALGKQKGIIRNGDELELDVHAQGDADRYIAEALDGGIEGTWNPAAKGRKRQARLAKNPAQSAEN
jgi:hypothetical protein